MNDTMVPRDDAELNEALYNAIIGSQSAGEQYSLQWFAERVLQYILQYFSTKFLSLFLFFFTFSAIRSIEKVLHLPKKSTSRF